jgi:organic radical activating enzyme
MSEELYNWRVNVLDSVSPSFCAAKWLNATIHLGHGYTHSCHLPIPHPISIEEIKIDPSTIHNTSHKKEQRAKMLKGERPAECDYCWKVEDIGRNNISDRVYKSMPYKLTDISKIAKQDPNTNVNLKTLEISFDRICNFACSYCNAGYSTAWARDIKLNGAYQGLKSDGCGAYHNDGSWTEPYGKFNENNPYVDAFFKWWPDLSKELEELRVTGGEATMSHNFWKLCDTIKEQDLSRLRFAVNSNLGMKQDILDQLVDFTKTANIKEFDLYTSNEAYGAQAEYIRDGLNYAEWRDNLVYFIDNAKFRSVVIMMTITSLSLFSITEFLDDMIVLKKKYGHNKPIVDLNILRWPSFMSPVAFPDHIKQHCRDNLISWFAVNRVHLNEGENAQIQRLIDYIEVVEQPHRRTSEESFLHNDIKSFYQQYDLRRGKNIKSVFPSILTDWLDTITIDKNIPIKDIGNGTITNYDK